MKKDGEIGGLYTLKAFKQTSKHSNELSPTFVHRDNNASKNILHLGKLQCKNTSEDQEIADETTWRKAFWS